MTIDRKVPLAFIATLLLQTGAAVWYAAAQHERIGALERRVAEMTVAAPGQAERLTRMEVQLAAVREAVAEIKSDVKALMRSRATRRGDEFVRPPG